MGIELSIIFGLIALGLVWYTVVHGNPLDHFVQYIVSTQHVHSWGKWERKTAKMFKTMSGVKVPNSDFTQVYQERQCKTCGKIEHQELSY